MNTGKTILNQRRYIMITVSYSSQNYNILYFSFSSTYAVKGQTEVDQAEDNNSCGC